MTNVTGLPLTTGVTGTLPVANGGTGAATLAANNVLLGDGTNALQAVAPGTTGNVLTSNGTTWSSTAPTLSFAGSSGQVFTASGTFTVPVGVSAVKVTLVGGGGGGGGVTVFSFNEGASGGGGGGGVCIAYVTGLTAGGTVAVTVGIAGTAGGVGATGGAGGTSSFGAYCSATGGGGGVGAGNAQDGAGGTAGVGSGGALNLSGSSGLSGSRANYFGGAGGGSNPAGSPIFLYDGNGTTIPALGFITGTGAIASYSSSGPPYSASGYGNGGGGIFRSGGPSASGVGGSGTGGIVIVEW
jgi:hypothetical protein